MSNLAIVAVGTLLIIGAIGIFMVGLIWWDKH